MVNFFSIRDSQNLSLRKPPLSSLGKGHLLSVLLISTVSSSLAAVPAPIVTPAVDTDSAAVPTWGTPRFSVDGGVTRVVFDLPNGVKYVLVPEGHRLRLSLRGTNLPAPQVTSLGQSGLRYMVDATGASLVTSYPLTTAEGWRARETVVASGGRVLIVDVGPTVLGGASGLPAQAGAALSTTSSGSLASSTPDPFAPHPVLEDGRQANVVSAGGQVSDLTPTKVAPAPALPVVAGEQPSGLSGVIPGTPGRGEKLGRPRIGINPGMTRVVLDLPAGTSYRLQPGREFIIDLNGPVTTVDGLQKVSPEVLAWQATPTPQGSRLTIQTNKPTRESGGWRGLILPAAEGKPARLVLDFSPAFANTAPLAASEKKIAAVLPRRVRTTGLALLGAASYARPVVLLDPGHGGIDPGAVGLVTEKIVTLDVALRVRRLLQEAGVDVVMTRDRDTQLHLEKSTDLNMRSEMARGKQLFVSIHANSTPPANVLRGYGIETWWNPNHPQSIKLASLIQREVIAQTSAFDRGIKSNQSLGVLRRNPAPAVLIEMGFTSHPVDGVNLQDTDYLDRVTLGIAQGIRALLVGE